MKIIGALRLQMNLPVKIFVLCLSLVLIDRSLHAQGGCSCPPLNSCVACSGGLTYLKLQYTEAGIITDMTASDNGGALTTSYQNGIITINSRTAGQPFDGDVKITVSKILATEDKQTFKTTCAEGIAPGQHIRHFDVLEASSVAGIVCCDDADMDKTKPTFTSCPSDMEVSTTTTSCGAAVTWTAPNATDNCGNITVTASNNPGDVFNVGTTTVTYTAKDDYNNTATCSFKVKVKDGTKPVISSCPANVSVAVSGSACNAVATWTAPTATDNCTLSSLTPDQASGTTFPIGVTTVTYTATDASGNVSTCSFTVTITDSVAPVIASCPSNISVTTTSSTACTATATWTAPTATDNCSVSSITPDHAPGSAFPIGTTTVTYTAKDASGNSATCSFTVTVTDKTNPVFTQCVTKDIVVDGKNDCSTKVSWTPPVATDNCGAVTLTSNHQPGDIFPGGKTVVTYTATDVSGNTATCSFNVIVNDNAPPVIQCVSDVTASTGTTCDAVVTWNAPAVTDCSVVTLVSVPTSGSLFKAGTTKVTYTATDASGNSSQCTFNVTVTDKTAPAFTNCPTVVNATADQSCSAVVSWTVPTATDNCSAVTLTSSHAPGSTFASGTTAVTYTAKDAAGNSTSCQFNVIVVDGKAMISNCPTDIEVQAGDSEQIAVTWTEPTVISTCSNESLTSTHSPGDAFPIGTTRVTYTLAGSDGSLGDCQFNVTVLPTDVSFDVNQLVSPNGDGINDLWQLPHIERFKDNKVVLLDRWGGVVFEASGYNNESIAWNGNNLKGGRAPAGTYFYTIVVQVNSQEIKRKGFIELIW
jgi:gliding motility-associated-like protein